MRGDGAKYFDAKSGSDIVGAALCWIWTLRASAPSYRFSFSGCCDYLGRRPGSLTRGHHDRITEFNSAESTELGRDLYTYGATKCVTA